MARINMKILGSLALIAGIISLCLPTYSLGYQVVNYSYHADGSVMTATTMQGTKKLEVTVFDSLGRTLKATEVKKGGNIVSTFSYNESTGRSTMRTKQGSGKNRLDEITYINEYGQNIITFDATRGSNSTLWEIYKGGKGNRSSRYSSWMRGLQASAGEALCDALDSLGVSGPRHRHNVKAKSGLLFSYFKGRSIKRVYAYDGGGRQKAYEFASSGKNFHTYGQYKGKHVLFAKEVAVNGANGKSIKTVKNMTDVAKYVTTSIFSWPANHPPWRHRH